MTKPPAQTDEKLDFLVYGAGAIGTYIGGSLALNGHRVVFLERPAVADQVRTRGLSLVIDGKTHHLSNPSVVDAFDSAIHERKFYAILFALKSFDTELAAETLARSPVSLPPILCLQNGVDNEPSLAAALGEANIIAGTVTSAIGRRIGGEIVLERRRGVGIAAVHARAPLIAGAMSQAGLNPRLYPDPAAMKWSKLLTNLLTNATAAILDMTPAEVLAHPGLFRLEMLQLREALGVMALQSTPVVDLPGTPVRALAFATRFLPLALARPLLARAVGSGRGEKMPSLHIDLHSGRGKSEAGYLNGAVVRHGARLGLPTPVNAGLTELVLDLTEKKMPLETFAQKPQALLDAVFQ